LSCAETSRGAARGQWPVRSCGRSGDELNGCAEVRTGKPPQAAEPSDFGRVFVAVFVAPGLDEESEDFDEDESEDEPSDVLDDGEWLPDPTRDSELEPLREWPRESLRESLR
jgi:hypothetical protein